MSEPQAAPVGHTYTLNGTPFTVGSKCDDKQARGVWICTTHGRSFGHNLEMHSHADRYRKPCVMAWWCTAHGVETP